MLAAVAQLATQIIMALLPDVIEAVRSGKSEAQIRRSVAIKLKRKAIETAYSEAAKELGR
jgi:hypothetical protein